MEKDPDHFPYINLLMDFPLAPDWQMAQAWGSITIAEVIFWTSRGWEDKIGPAEEERSGAGDRMKGSYSLPDLGVGCVVDCVCVRERGRHCVHVSKSDIVSVDVSRTRRQVLRLVLLWSNQSDSNNKAYWVN